MSLVVVHVVCSDRFAGTERHVATLAAAQQNAGHRVHVVGGGEAVARQAPGVAHLPAVSVVDAVVALRRVAGVDILHAHMSDAEVAVALHAGHRDAARVATRHFARRRGSGALRRVATGAAARRLDGQLAVSRYVADHVESPATVVHPGVVDRPDQRAERAPTVLVVQRLEAEKATDVAIRAFARASLPDPWRMQIAGSGSQLPALRLLAAEVGMADRIDFLGIRADVPELMERASLFCAPCPVEGLGLAVVEAMSAGLPVIASGAGGHLESVGEVDDRWLFDPGDADSAADRLRHLVGDDTGRAHYGAALQARQRSHFSIDQWRASTDEFYGRLR